MTISDAVQEWESKSRKMGCVAATKWFCTRVEGFRPARANRYTKGGEEYEHVVAFNGLIVVDLTPHLDLPENFDLKTDGELRLCLKP